MARFTMLDYWATRLSMGLKFLMMVFRALLPTRSNASSTLLPSEPTLSEPISRFILHSGDFGVQPPRVKARALEPSPKDNETSVFRTIGLTEAGIWQLATNHVDGPRGLCRARADLQVRAAVNIGLSVEPKEPPPRHANIVKWPGKDERMSLAQRLAAEATLVIRSVEATG